MNTQKLPTVTLPGLDEWFFKQIVGYNDPERTKAVSYMYSVLESRCGTGIEAKVCIALCAEVYRRAKRPAEVRDYIHPQFSVGWCRLDFLVFPDPDRPRVSVGVECDGEFWHDDKRDSSRDRYLSRAGFTIARLKDKDINEHSKTQMLVRIALDKAREGPIERGPANIYNPDEEAVLPA